MKITVIGTGYVGLVTGACLAHMGHDVICADISVEKIATLQSGGLPIWEHGLKGIIDGARNENRIQFTTDMAQAIQESEVLFIAVGTPSLPDGNADLSQLWSIVVQIATVSQSDKTIVIKSTVPVGTSDEVEAVLRHLSSDPLHFEVVSNPEFLRQGNAVYDFLHPDRIVIGCSSSRARKTMSLIYKDFSVPIQFCDRRSAEMIKYASNTFLAMKISYINMIAGLSEKVGANVDEVARGMGLDRRIGPSFLQAGIGYGGSCLPKDTSALLALGKRLDHELPLVEAAVKINKEQSQLIIKKLRHSLGSLNQKRIAILGLSFKPMTDDIREAPSLSVIRQCLKEGAIIRAYDPLVHDYPLKDITLCHDEYSAIQFCDAIVILTEWEQFRHLDWERISQKLRLPLIVDGRNIFSLKQMEAICEKYGLIYFSVGRPTIFGTFGCDAKEKTSILEELKAAINGL
ncbi:UDP-glucose/GDP-mannose dehydrogenase family protein [Microaerobacter geothermalis]|uniref:UDP-glucose dehydrogenase family protein n=1 Tax=Microaerobacter geothermalis TaxID=674972 RepID=UPI001F1FEA04|nr:UDP-glucose/GDP-mannose dehydrogenase family protein [Microaerobacter geothermalis]MCF6093711.1 UDP-glucose/GDP-mannose dehydrogenase family protein [Microaerobacter geothermalis]